MATHNPVVLTPLSTHDLLRIKRWYLAYTSDRNSRIEPADVVLDAKLRSLRYDAQDRLDAREFAVRDTHAAKQYPGPERRGIVPRQRLIRVAQRATVSH